MYISKSKIYLKLKYYSNKYVPVLTIVTGLLLVCPLGIIAIGYFGNENLKRKCLRA
jgi:hypothetical protein